MFVDKGINCIPTSGYKKKIFGHMVYVVKNDGMHKAGLVAGGPCTDSTTNTVFPGGDSFHGIRLIVFLAILNGFKVWGAHSWNVYLEAKTKDEIFIVGGPRCSSLDGDMIIIDKVSYI
jgi:hypothetical protein